MVAAWELDPLVALLLQDGTLLVGSNELSEWAQIVFFRFLIRSEARRNPATYGTNQGD